MSILGPKIRKTLGFSPVKSVRGTYEHPIGDKVFQDITSRVAKFHENRPRDVK